MMPLSRAQAVKLINIIEFDKAVKKKFLRKLKNDLYEKYQSFASRPLLLTMMLITFSYYAYISEKIHVFYDQYFVFTARCHQRSV